MSVILDKNLLTILILVFLLRCNSLKHAIQIKHILATLASLLLVLNIIAIALPPINAQKPPVSFVLWYTLPPTITWNPFVSGGVIASNDWVIKCTVPLFAFSLVKNIFFPVLGKDLKVSPEGYIEVTLWNDSHWFDGKSLYPFTAKDVWTYYMIQWKIFRNFIPWLRDITIVNDYTIRFYFNKTTFTQTAPIYDPKTGRIDTSKVFSYGFSTNFWYQGLFQLLTWSISTPYKVFGKYADMVADVPVNEVPKRFNLTALQNEVRNLPIDTPWCNGIWWYDPATLTTTGVKLKKNPGYRWAKYVQYDEGEVLFARAEEQMVAWMIEGRNLHTWHGLSPLTLVEITKAPGGVKVSWVWGYELWGLWFNILKYPFNITEVRQAIVMLLNNTESSLAYQPQMVPFNDYITSLANSKELPSWIRNNLYDWSYNPQKAYQLLESVGFKRGADGKWYMPNGQPFRFEILSVSAWADFVSLATNIASQLQQHGIGADVVNVDVGVYWDMWMNWQFDTAISWTAGNALSITAAGLNAFINSFYPAQNLAQSKFNYTWPVPLKNGTVIYVNPYYEQMKLQASVPGTSSFWDAIAKLAWFWNYYIPTYPIWNFRRGWQVSIVESNFAELLGVPDAQIDVGGYKMYGWGIDKSWVATAWYSGSYSVYVWMMYGILKKPTTPLPWPPSKPPVNPYNLLPSEAKIVSITDLAKPFLSPTTTPTTSPTTTVTTPPATTAPPPTTAMTTTVTTTVVVPTTILSTVVSTVSSVSTATLTATTTVTQRVTEWTTTIAIAIALLIIGFAIGWITKRK
jgi:peptide/nickel transport system substrate-binding protein